jgi:CRP/FNR family cyclic AMP-dependent transcriptional regulator
MAESIKLKPTEVLIREGDTSDSMYYVQKGELVVTKVVDNKKVILDKIIQGQLVGEVSFIDKKPRSATVSALSFCELVEIPRETFNKTLESQPTWLQAMFKTLAERLRKADERIRI